MTDRAHRDERGAGGPGEEQDRYAGRLDLTRWETPVGRGLAAGAHRISDRIGPHPTLIVTLVVGLVIASGFSVAAAKVYDSVTDADGVAALDMPILDAAIGVRSPVLNAIAASIAIAFGPVWMPILAGVIAIALALRRRAWTPVTLIVAAGAGSLIMTIAGKDIIGRRRPPLSLAVPPFEHSPSFPSGHTLNALVIAGIVAYLLLLRRTTARGRVLTVAVALVVAVAVGISRVILGAHWFTDVLAGWILGAAWLALVITAHRLYLTTRTRPAPA